MKYSKIILLGFLFISNFGLSQQNKVGVEIGYGKSYIGTSRILPFGSNTFDAYSFGLQYYKTPEKAPFELKTGLTYSHSIQEQAKFNFLNIPLGIQFGFGKRLHFFIGTSLNAKFLLSYNSELINQIKSFENDLSKVQLSWDMFGGVGYKFNEAIDIRLFYSNLYDLSSLYTESNTSISGAKYDVEGKSSIGLIKCGVVYSLK